MRIIAAVLLRIILILSPVKSHHRERIPRGACILCPNHQALRDPFYVALAARRYTGLHFMTKAPYFDNPIIGPLIRTFGGFRVDQEKGYLSAIRDAMMYLKKDEIVCIFPEGTRNKKGEDLEGKAGAAMIAARMGVPVVPVKITNGRKFFRIIHVTFGEPIIIEPVARGENYHGAADRIMREIHAL